MVQLTRQQINIIKSNARTIRSINRKLEVIQGKIAALQLEADTLSADIDALDAITIERTGGYKTLDYLLLLELGEDIQEAPQQEASEAENIVDSDLPFMN